MLRLVKLNGRRSPRSQCFALDAPIRTCPSAAGDIRTRPVGYGSKDSVKLMKR